MRYMVMVVALIVIAVLAVSPFCAYGGDVYYGSGELADYQRGYQPGWDPVKISKTYTFGVIDKEGRCSTVQVYSDKYVHALQEVKDSCTGCKIENITDKTYQGEATWDIRPLNEMYCLIR